MLADTQDRLDYLGTVRGRSRCPGLDTELTDLQESVVLPEPPFDPAGSRMRS